jgi:hypothetical protein
MNLIQIFFNNLKYSTKIVENFLKNSEISVYVCSFLLLLVMAKFAGPIAVVCTPQGDKTWPECGDRHKIVRSSPQPL